MLKIYIVFNKDTATTATTTTTTTTTATTTNDNNTSNNTSNNNNNNNNNNNDNNYNINRRIYLNLCFFKSNQSTAGHKAMKPAVNVS